MTASLGATQTWSTQSAAALKQHGFHGLVPPQPAAARRRSHHPQQPGSPTTIQEETEPPQPPQPSLAREPSRRHSRRRKAPTYLATVLALFLSVGAFFLEQMGQTGRARGIFERWVTKARRLRRTWAERVKAGPLGGITRALSKTFSSLSLETMDQTQRVAGLIRRALSHEGRLDSVAAIKAYQVSVGAAWDWAGHRWGRRRRQHGAGRAPAGSQQQRRAIKALYAEDSLPAPGCF